MSEIGSILATVSMKAMTLEPIDSKTALELYLADRENELTQATLYSHKSRLGHFCRWTEEVGIENLNLLTGRMLHEYRLWRRDEGELARPSEKSQMDTLRVFIRWLENIDGVEQNLHEKVRVPNLSDGVGVRDEMLSNERADEILDYLSTFDYASRPHVAIATLAHTMMRIGSLRAIDIGDYDEDEQSLNLVHRPDMGTPLKNKAKGERYVAISDELCELLDDWIKHQRPDSTDQYGRKPLISTPEGRVHLSTIRGDVYRHTRPCTLGEECPHDRDPTECIATKYDTASKCPSSKSPHTIRRGALTHALKNEWPEQQLGQRASVSTEILEIHYDERSKKKRMDQRRKYLDQL